MSSFLWPLIDNPASAMSLVRVSDGTPVAERVDAAFSSADRRRGLLGRDGLPLGTTLVIAPCNSVHTFFMRFAIDVVFVSREGSILKIVEDLPAWRIAAAPRAFATLEFAAGGARRAGLAVGDLLTLVPAPAG